MRRSTASHVYALSSLPGTRNVQDTRNYSRDYRQRLRAEVMLDAIVEIKVGRQTVLQALIRPVARVWSAALREPG